MTQATLLVVVIETPNSLRSVPLISKLEDDLRFNLVRLPAVMLNSYQEIEEKHIEINLTDFEFFNGRTMTPGEIGCAHSHNLARAIISNTFAGGVVLEDDARITDVDIFYQSAKDFLEKFHTEAAVCSLNDFRSSNALPFKKHGFQRLWGSPYLAVGYAATSIAANALYKANLPIRTVSDWPTSSTTYYSIYDPVVLHGDIEVESTIDINGSIARNGKTLHKKIFDLLFISFFSKRNKTISFREYVYYVYYAKITWRIDAITRRFLRAVYRWPTK